MVNKNIQMKVRNGNQWENLFPLTLIENVFNVKGESLKTELETLNTELTNKINGNTNQIIELNNFIDSITIGQGEEW